ncbi:hypothetical protein EniLVp02_0110 [Vibrio phage EniLVp02]
MYGLKVCNRRPSHTGNRKKLSHIKRDALAGCPFFVGSI